MNRLQPLKNVSGAISFVILSITAGLFTTACNHHPDKGDLSFNGKEDFADSAVSRIRIYKDDKGRSTIQKDNTYYDIVELHDSVGLKKILMKITKMETGLVDSGTSQSHFAVSAANLGDTKMAWKNEFPGTDIDYSTKVLVVHTEGKNQNEEDTYTQYSLMTGEKLMTYTYAPLSVLILGDGRFLGYLSQQSATDKPDGYATISYVSRNNLIDKIGIKLKNGDTTMPAYTPELKMQADEESGNSISNEGKTVIMSRVDKGFTAKDINNFAMLINYTPAGSSNPISILIPVRNDHLDLARATYDKNIFELSKVN